jgi:hypothetical protein
VSDPGAVVRTARVRLARALIGPDASSGEVDEAEMQLKLALAGAPLRPEPDSDGSVEPARWEVLEELASIAGVRGHRQREVDRLIEAVLAAPSEPASALADRVLLLLGDATAGGLVEGLPPAVSAQLWEAAHDLGRPDAVVRLAARVALARGHVSAASEVSRQRGSVASPGTDLHAVTVVAAVLASLAEGDVDAAETQLSEVRDFVQEPSVVLAEALLHYARGDLQTALDLVDSRSAAGDLSTVAVISLLREGAAMSDPSDAFTAARNAATRAVRHDPSSGEPALLRAQVLLEAGVELDLGRELLGTALSRLESAQALDALPWWRVQERARTDDRYTYFRVEVAAARNQPEELLRLAGSYGAHGTTYLQDARLKELWAGRVDDQAEAARLLSSAAADYRQGSELSGAVRCLRVLVKREPGSRSALELTDALWASSFGTEAATGLEYVNEGLQLLGALEGQHPQDSLARACLLWGLLLVRLDTLAVNEEHIRADERWRPLPHLLLAALLDPEAPYSWAHLAWACTDADLRWPAAWASRSALALMPEDSWLLETGVAAEINWGGAITDEALLQWLRSVPEDIEPPGWVAAVQGYDLLLRGQAGAAAELVPAMDLDAWWAREIRVHSLALGQSLSDHLGDVRAMVDEADDRGSLLDAAWYALLFDVDRARELAERAAADGARPPGTAVQLAEIELVTSGAGSGLERLDAALRQTRRPWRLSEERSVRLPLLALTQDEPMQAVLGAMVERASTLLEGLDPVPALTAELDANETWCNDSDLAELVRRVLERATFPDQEAGDLPAVPSLPGAATVAAAWKALSPSGP